jgi:hypothetical protein
MRADSSILSYHMMYYHGISPATGLPFSPPVDIRVVPHVPRSKVEKDQLREGKCHRCQRWIVLDTVKKEHETKVRARGLLLLLSFVVLSTRSLKLPLGQRAILVETLRFLSWSDSSCG